MTRQQIKEALNKIYVSLPQDFNLREVRFYVYQAIQKLDHMEKKQYKKEMTKQPKEPVASFTNQQITPFAKQSAMTSLKLEHFLINKINIIDKMIQDEENKIAEIIAKKGNINRSTGNIQTYFG